MGKKKAYKLPEYEHQHNRVDIFRTIQLPRNIEQSDPPPPFIFNIDMNNVASVPSTILNANRTNANLAATRSNNFDQSLNSTLDSLTQQQNNNTQNPISTFQYLNSYSNEAFVSSSNDLTLNNSSDFLPNRKKDLFAGKAMPPINREVERDRDEDFSQPDQFVWTTTGNSQHPGAKFIQTGNKLAALANANSRQLKKSRVVSESPTSLSEREEPNARKRRHVVIWVLIGLFLLLALTAVGLALTFTILKSKGYNQRCFSSCDKNQYCIKNPASLLSSAAAMPTTTTTSSSLSVPFLSSLANSLLPQTSQSSHAPYCTCKPGYTFDSNNIFIDNSTCKQTVCYDGFYPYTYLNGYSPQIPLPHDTQYIKPYCCPNPHFLTNACCGVSMSNATLSLSKRIIGGSQSSSGMFPWMVYVTQVYRLGPNSPTTMIKNCSGVLLSDRYVLTAGHCTDLDSMIELNDEFPTSESLIRVYFGFIDKSQIFKPNVLGRHERFVRKIYKHPNYKQSTLQNDLAILELTQSINRDINSDYICLFNYANDDSLVTQTKLYMAGWGSINPSHMNLVYPDVLHHVDAIVFPMSFCTYIYPEPAFSFIFNSTTHVCAGYPANYNKDSCYADSGAPLMLNLNGQWFVYGLVTFGSQPDCGLGPSMFMRISFYYDWIKKVIK